MKSIYSVADLRESPDLCEDSLDDLAELFGETEALVPTDIVVHGYLQSEYDAGLLFGGISDVARVACYILKENGIHPREMTEDIINIGLAYANLPLFAETKDGWLDLLDLPNTAIDTFLTSAIGYHATAFAPKDGDATPHKAAMLTSRTLHMCYEFYEHRRDQGEEEWLDPSSSYEDLLAWEPGHQVIACLIRHINQALTKAKGH